MMSLRMRRRMFKEFMAFFKPGPATRIVDVGLTPDTSLPESNFFEKWYPYPWNVVGTGIEDLSCLKRQFPSVTLVRTEKYQLPFADRSFDLSFCAAVLEHSGHYFRQKALVRELLRVSSRFCVFTPNRFFPVEFHTLLPFLHWLPQSRHQKVLKLMGKNFWANTDNLNLLDRHGLRQLFPGKASVKIKNFRLLGMTSNLMAYGESRP